MPLAAAEAALLDEHRRLTRSEARAVAHLPLDELPALIALAAYIPALRNDFVSLPYVVKLINNRILSKHPRITVEAFADAYNSGRPDDGIVPTDYIAKFVKAYTGWLLKIDPPEILTT